MNLTEDDFKWADEIINNLKPQKPRYVIIPLYDEEQLLHLDLEKPDDLAIFQEYLNKNDTA
jgi:hypothetical protein